jgi:hypothetical protein
MDMESATPPRPPPSRPPPSFELAGTVTTDPYEKHTHNPVVRRPQPYSSIGRTREDFRPLQPSQQQKQVCGNGDRVRQPYSAIGGTREDFRPVQEVQQRELLCGDGENIRQPSNAIGGPREDWQFNIGSRCADRHRAPRIHSEITEGFNLTAFTQLASRRGRGCT